MGGTLLVFIERSKRPPALTYVAWKATRRATNRYADPSFDFDTRHESPSYVPELALLALTLAIVRLIRRCFSNLSGLSRNMVMWSRPWIRWQIGHSVVDSEEKL